MNWEGLAQAVLLALALGFLTERGTEVLKKISRFLGTKTDRFEGIQGDASFIVSAIVAAAMVFVPDMNVLENVQGLGFELANPDLLKGIFSALILVFGNKISDKLQE